MTNVTTGRESSATLMLLLPFMSGINGSRKLINRLYRAIKRLTAIKSALAPLLQFRIIACAMTLPPSKRRTDKRMEHFFTAAGKINSLRFIKHKNQPEKY